MPMKEIHPNLVFADVVYFRPPMAAEYTAISESKLAKLRMASNRHLGPRFAKVAGCVLYRRDDLDMWLAAHLVDSEGCDK